MTSEIQLRTPLTIALVLAFFGFRRLLRRMERERHDDPDCSGKR